MEKKNLSTFKICMTIFFTILVLGAFLLNIFYTFPTETKIEPAYISFGCIAASFLFSLIFVRANAKKILITLALAVNVVADYFLMLAPVSENNRLIGLCVFCGVQFFYMLYTLSLTKSIGGKIVNLASRVALCLLAYFIIPRYVELNVLQLIAVMYILNSFVTLVCMLFKIKTEWLTFVGFLLFIICDIVIGFKMGLIEMFNLSGAFIDFLLKYDVAYYCYIPGIFAIATSSVWAIEKTN